MGSLAKELAKRRKKELKAQLKLEKKRRKLVSAAMSPAAESVRPSAFPSSEPAANDLDEKQLKEESVRIHRWRLWAAIVGVIISAIGLALRIYQFLSQ